MRTIVIATPHSRYDPLEQRLRNTLSRYVIVRVRAQEDLTVQMLQEVQPDFIFFPHWSSVIPEEIHSRFECVIFHMTDLPYGRGGSPLQNLIVRGHEDTMLTALKCVSGLDAGPLYLKRPLSLAGTAEEIMGRAAYLIEEMIVEIVSDRPVPIPQHGDVVVFKRRKPEDGNIALLGAVEQVYDFIRMLDGEGYPPAFLDVGNLHLEFSDARMQAGFVEAKVRIRKVTK